MDLILEYQPQLIVDTLMTIKLALTWLVIALIFGLLGSLGQAILQSSGAASGRTLHDHRARCGRSRADPVGVRWRSSGAEQYRRADRTLGLY